MVWIKFSAFLWNRSSFQTCSTKRINTLYRYIYIYHEEHIIWSCEKLGGPQFLHLPQKCFPSRARSSCSFWSSLCGEWDWARHHYRRRPRSSSSSSWSHPSRSASSPLSRSSLLFPLGFRSVSTAKQIFIRRLKTQSDALLNWSRIHTRSVVIFKMFFFRNFILYRWYTYLRYIWSLDRRWCVTKVKNKNFGIVN